MTASGLSSDHERFTAWLREHGDAVRGYLWAVTRRHDLAEDLAQEAFRRAWQARERYRDEGNARGYLLTIADRLACDWARRAGREETMDATQWELRQPEAREGSPGLNATQLELQQQLSAALAGLAPLQQRVLLMRYYGELSFQEIAAALETPLNTVLSHCRRGLATLRKQLVEEQI
jgi:RNA polymerase sigma-70 factor, ECF subfamily